MLLPGLLSASLVAGVLGDNAAWLASNLEQPGWRELESGLQYRVVKSGPEDGTSPGLSDACKCHYAGKLIDGTEFDSSIKRGRPATFAPNQVIAGWTEALQLMKPGDEWELAIPPKIGYGGRRSGKIPGNSILLFTLELIAVEDAGSFDFLFGSKLWLLVLGTAFWLYGQLGGGGAPKGPKLSADSQLGQAGNPKVFLDMSLGGSPAGRVEIELFSGVRAAAWNVLVV